MAASLVQVACLGTPADDEDDVVGEHDQGVTIHNELSPNGLSSNGLSSNGLSSNGLSSNGLSSNGLAMEALETPEGREVLSYIVSCALPEGAHFDLEIDGVTYGFDGAIGLAPQWGHDWGHCNKECRSWVSACVLSRVNYLGEHVMISIRGKHYALGTTLDERANFTHREAAYYGDIFTEPKRLYACLSPGESEIPRVCGPSVQNCIVDVIGDCDDVCQGEKWDGAFKSCWDKKNKKHGKKKGKKHTGVVTVFLDP